MQWTELHGPLLARAFETVLGRSEYGSMAYARCLTPDVVERLSLDVMFKPSGWRVLRVADVNAAEERTLTADRAVEIRETKGDATLLLVDTERVGAGMDGIYNASREADEASLFREAHRLGGEEIATRLSGASRLYAQRAIKKAQGHGRSYAVSKWAQFDFLCRIAATGTPPGAHLHLLGLWPVLDSAESNEADNLNTSRLFVNGLLGTAGASLVPAARIAALRLDKESERARGDLERFLRSVDTKPLLAALEALSEQPHLWIGPLRIRSATQSIQGIELISWRNRDGTIARWSGLVEDPDENTSGEAKPPVLILARDDEQVGGTLEVRWKPDPADLAKGAVGYRVSVRTDMDEEIAFLDHIPHAARKGGEKRRFGNDDFSSLSEDTVLQAKVVVEVAGNDSIEPQESEEFTIRFGQRPEQVGGSVGEPVRTFSEGLAAVESRETVSAAAASSPAIVDAKGFVVLRTPVERGRRRSFRVYRPSLVADVEKEWIDKQGAVGRWTVAVRGSGSRAGAPEFVSMDDHHGLQWDRAVAASRKMAARFETGGGGVGQVYDDDAASFGVVKEYLRAWAALLEAGDPSLAIAHTVEVRSLADHTIGLIVLPAHPLRVAWHAAYDNLVLHTAFEQEQDAKEIRKEFRALDGAMFPAFLPNPRGGAFVFADTLGFHAVGMVPDTAKEPKAAMAVLAHVLGEGLSADSAPLVGSRSASVLANEIVKYLECHRSETDGRTGYASPLLQVHALRAGDGLTVARALGGVHAHYSQGEEEEEGDEQNADEERTAAPAFSLDLYPSWEQRGVAGRFIADAREKRRSGAGVLAGDDRWMLESLSLPGGVNMPRLRWARKEPKEGEAAARPDSAAHLAIAFDTFETEVVAGNEAMGGSGPYHAFGLLAFYERRYWSVPAPVWQSATAPATLGEKHPSRRSHTETLTRLQDAVEHSVARHICAAVGRPVLRTEISPDKSDSLRHLHRLCDWVVTLDRNAGIEYFDSPRGNPDIYDAYIIDCVPEGEDLGCLQLITSTANLEEVRILLDDALDQMALSRSRRNAEFLLEHLKALSGRLAIRLTGHRPATSELIALAVSHANCRSALPNDECWVSLQDGFIIPVDDVRDLIPQLAATSEEEKARSRPDLIHVSTAPRKGLMFRFIEVKYRRDLRAARKPDLLRHIKQQTRGLRERWNGWYGHDGVCTTFRAIRRAKLARVLRFYADKAHRHYLPAERHAAVLSEIDRMVELGGGYALSTIGTNDRGWVFCPEYAGIRPTKISPDDWSTEIFLFGPGLLPDSDSGNETVPGTAARFKMNRVGQPSSDGTERHAESSREEVDKDPSEEPREGPRDPQQAVDAPPPAVQLGTDALTGADVRWALTVKGNPHLLIAGLPGMGKTTCLVNLCRQMVTAGVRPIIFSYHQDIDEQLTGLVASVRFIDFDGLGFNPLTVRNPESPRAYLDVAGSLRDIFAAIYPELGDLQCESIRRALKESFSEAGWDGSEAGAQEPEFRRFVEILRAEPKPDRGLRTLLARLTELDDYGFFNVGETRGSLWASDRATVVRIHTTQNAALQRAFASLVFYGLYQDMFGRGVQERITHALIFDEAHRAAGLRLIPTMAKECRKYGISLVLASQEARDFNASLFSAIANYLVLRMTETDAKALVRNVATAKQERTLIDRIKQMPRFRALYFSEERHRPSSVNLSALD